MKRKAISIICIYIFISFLFIFNSFASIALRIVKVNPSNKARTVVVSAYLPKEITPDDVIDSDGLEVKFDSQENAYYVYGEFELAPQEVVEREIEIEDVWKIPPQELDMLQSEIDKVVEALENSGIAERVKFIKERMYRNLEKVQESQEQEKPNPQKHISVYRQNKKIMKEIREDLDAAQSLLIEEKGLAAKKIWGIFVGVIIFLGLLGVGFYAFWRKQSETMDEVNAKDKSSRPEITKPEEVGQDKKSGQSGVDDIEKIMREEDNE